MIRKRLSTLVLLLPALVIGGESCADLPEVERGTCGNHVIDPGEECDTFAEPDQRCRGADEAHACRFDCSEAKCPEGYACNTNDGVCRKPSSTFSDTPSITFEANANRLTIRDFDGDGRGDVLAESSTDEAGRGSVRAFYFDDPTQAPKVTPLSATTMSPAIADMDGDKRADIVFNAFETGVNVLLGRSDRAFGPIAFSRVPFPPGTSARVVRVEGIKDALSIFGVPVVFANPMGLSVITLGSIDDPLKTIFAMLDRPPSKLLGAPVGANIVDGVGKECEEILFAWQGERTVLWVAPCAGGNTLVPNPTATPKPLVTLPTDDELVRPPVTSDVNNDGHEDLLITGKVRSYIAFGRGDGTFSNTPDLTGSTQMSEIECDLSYGGEIIAEATNCSGGALAGYTRSKALPARPGDAPLLVFPNVVLSVTKVAMSTLLPQRVKLSGVPIATRSTGQWTTAHIADFNGNGYVDIAAASSGASDIDFFNGTPFGLVNPSKLPTDGPIAYLSAGDYDGDLVTDLSYVETGVGGEGIDGLSVAYGRFMAPPERGLRMGTFQNIRELETAKLSGFDAIEQIGIIYGTDPDELAILEGAGDRQLLSAFGFAQTIDGKITRGLPYVTLVGQFDDNKANVDALVLGYDASSNATTGEKSGPLRFWHAPGIGGGRFGAPAASAEIKSFELVSRDPDARYRVAVVARTAAADLDGDGKDEAIILASEPAPSLRGATLSIARVQGVDHTAKITVSDPMPLPGAKAAYRRMDLEIADVDGDGKLDAIMLLHAVTTTAMIAWGDGKSFDVANAVKIELPAEAGRAQGVVALQLDNDAGKELAIATTAGVYSVDAKGRAVTVARLGNLPPASAIAVGDINADGIPDLALANDHRVGIHLGGAKNP